MGATIIVLLLAALTALVTFWIAVPIIMVLTPLGFTAGLIFWFVICGVCWMIGVSGWR